jgi:GNAT superfamily N-acetyltransferase
MGLRTRKFDPTQASSDEFAAMNVFENQQLEESWPDDPPDELDETIRHWTSAPVFEERGAWITERIADGCIVARGMVTWWDMGQNRHLADVDLYVVPEMRRQRLATPLLGRIAAAADQAGRRLLLFATEPDIPAGPALMERVGAEEGLRAHTNQATISDVDISMMRRWQERARERAADFEIACWDGPYPDDDLDAILELMEVMNTAPRDDLDMEDFHLTAEEVREFERVDALRQEERWTMYARHRASGEFAGYTEVRYQPTKPHLVHQGDTGVLPAFRNRGLGRWMKAAMFERIVLERPEVRYIRTGNADSNTAMHSINREMGFRPRKSWTIWQAEISRVMDYVRAHGVTV